MSMYDFAGGTSAYEPTHRQAAEAVTDAHAAQRDVKDLEVELARMKLACAAVWDLVKEKTALTEDDLVARMAVLDAKDGVADGRLSHTPRKCAQCGRVVGLKQSKCMYCGAVQPLESVFESL